MDFFNILTFVGGLALFLYGMNVMGSGLEKLSGGKLEHVLERLTSNKMKGVLLGVLVTAVIQSSSATTVMVVGFVNSGIMQLSQGISVIMGANVGTTITSWLLSLSEIDGGNFFIQLLKPSSFSPILALVGIVFLMSSKNNKKRDIASIMLGFAVLMFGMTTMSDAVAPLADNPSFTGILTVFSNPLLGVLAGALITAVIQSSSASVGILQALSSTGSLSFSSAIPIIMGQNIGTCVTALISSVGANKNARRVAVVHLYFNIIGTILFLILYYVAMAIFDFSFLDEAVSPSSIAVVHTIFNFTATAALLPFTKQLEKLARLTVRDSEISKSEQSEFVLLDERFLNTPSFAIDQCHTLSVKMADLTQLTLELSMDIIKNYNAEIGEEIIQHENSCDEYEDKLGTYLVKLSAKNLTDRDSRQISLLLHCIGDFERISDHAVNILEAAQEMHKKKLDFSDKAKDELAVYISAISEIVNITFTAFKTADTTVAKTVEPLEEVIDNLRNELKKRHVKRLRKGKCTIEMGFILSDLLTNFERIADHCSNIAVSIIQIEEDSFDTHEYINELKKTEDAFFLEKFAFFTQKYTLPKKAKD